MSRGGDAAVAALEGRLGYTFANRDLLLTALTHASANLAGRGNYERFEFLGDRVLGLVVAEMLFAAYPMAGEGELSQRLADLVRLETCAEVGAALDLASAIRAPGVKTRDAGGAWHTILGDACEALIAAIYLDGGLGPARAFIVAHWQERMLRWAGARKDAKSALQEWAQARGLPTPAYAIVARSGPDHAPRFEIEVRVQGFEPAVAAGRSRRDAERDAATAMLAREGVWNAENHAG